MEPHIGCLKTIVSFAGLAVRLALVHVAGDFYLIPLLDFILILETKSSIAEYIVP